MRQQLSQPGLGLRYATTGPQPAPMICEPSARRNAVWARTSLVLAVALLLVLGLPAPPASAAFAHGSSWTWGPGGHGGFLDMWWTYECPGGDGPLQPDTMGGDGTTHTERFLAASGTWADPNTLHDHTARHGPDFGITGSDPAAQERYAGLANESFRRGLADLKVRVKQDAGGTIRMWDPATDEFGSYRMNGMTRTYYKPHPNEHGLSDNQAYWDKQEGADPR